MAPKPTKKETNPQTTNKKVMWTLSQEKSWVFVYLFLVLSGYLEFLQILYLLGFHSSLVVSLFLNLQLDHDLYLKRINFSYLCTTSGLLTVLFYYAFNEFDIDFTVYILFLLFLHILLSSLCVYMSLPGALKVSA